MEGRKICEVPGWAREKIRIVLAKHAFSEGVLGGGGLCFPFVWSCD